MRRYNLITVLVLSFNIAYGQLSTEESPISFGKNIPALNISRNTHKVLPSLDMNRIEQEDMEDEANGMPFRFGYKHDVDYNLNNSGEWTVLSDGSRIWRLSISCPDALSIIAIELLLYYIRLQQTILKYPMLK
jgi:hypothetical protein